MSVSEPGQPRIKRRPRTAVLVVHGMGSQRALDTVRGVIDAVWRQDSDDPKAEKDPPRRVWTHPEYSGVDIDLSVMTTSDLTVNAADGAQRRCIDFHELYWAHLMSETRAVAVLLWLFELVRKGPKLKPGMNALWWGASIFLCMLLASVVLLGFHAILQFLGNPPLISDGKLELGAISGSAIKLTNHSYHEPQALLITPLFLICMIATFTAVSSAILLAARIAIPAAIMAVVSCLLYVWLDGVSLVHVTELFLPIFVSLGAAYVIMGWRGSQVTLLSYLCAFIFFGFSLQVRHMITKSCDPEAVPSVCAYLWDINALTDIWNRGWVFWSLNERYSALIAVWVIIVYLAIYGLFLQPYLGDAARYFRNSPGNVAVRRKIRKEAVDTLAALHTSGRYDRIVVVAHSLGTVVAYDMLRAYYSRICNELPNPRQLGVDTDIDYINDFEKAPPGGDDARQIEFRRRSRDIVRAIAAFPGPEPDSRETPVATWLVTDFVTMGSPLTHAEYLMCNGTTHRALKADFDRRVEEREFPTCPPARLAPDGCLLFTNQTTKAPEFHHGSLFGLTRWTNLYFPLKQLFWGDAIGGPLEPLFGANVVDKKVWTDPDERANFFTHTAYWSVNWPHQRRAYQIAALKDAINLEDVAF